MNRFIVYFTVGFLLLQCGNSSLRTGNSYPCDPAIAGHELLTYILTYPEVADYLGNYNSTIASEKLDIYFKSPYIGEALPLKETRYNIHYVSACTSTKLGKRRSLVVDVSMPTDSVANVVLSFEGEGMKGASTLKRRGCQWVGIINVWEH